MPLVRRRDFFIVFYESHPSRVIWNSSASVKEIFKKLVGKISIGPGKGGDEETKQEDLLLPGPAGEAPQEKGAGGAPGSQ
jgi:hypothetical protein